MKHLTVIIRAELEIPDEWEMVEHPDGQVLKIGDEYVAFDLTPFSTKSETEDADWTDVNAKLLDSVIDAVADSETELVLRTQH